MWVHHRDLRAAIRASFDGIPGTIERGNPWDHRRDSLLRVERHNAQRIGMSRAKRFIGNAPYLLSIDAEVRLEPDIILVRGTCPYLFLQAGIGMNHRLQAVPHEQFYRLL